jgi:putative membrane protein
MSATTESPRSGTPDPRTLLEAEFDPAVTTYWLANGFIILLATVVGIPLIPLWIIFGKLVTTRYLKSHHCELTTRSLKFRKGILTRQEKTVPLDKITDLGFVQGPLMRLFGVEALSIETAGQSGPGALVQLQGIKNARDFRDRVLEQRDRVTELQNAAEGNPPGTSGESDSAQIALLTEIRDILLRQEQREH